jgi:hypothetical protein
VIGSEEYVRVKHRLYELLGVSRSV